MKKLNLDINKLFPAAARRVEILRELKLVWASVAGPVLARHSFPCVLGVNTITVAVRDKTAANFIINMKGNIKRALISRWKYEADEKFSLKIIIGVPKKINKPEAKKDVNANINIEVDENKVREYMQGAPETLPDDINYAISHLRVFMETRFCRNIKAINRQ